MKIPANVTDKTASIQKFLSRDKSKDKRPLEDRLKEKGQSEKESRDKANQLKGTVAELQAALAEKEKQIEALTGERDGFSKQVTDLTPHADQWKDYEHKERTKILALIPTEHQKEAKSLPINALRTYSKAFIAPAEGKRVSGNGKYKTLEEAAAAGDTDAINKMVEAELAAK